MEATTGMVAYCFRAVALRLRRSSTSTTVQDSLGGSGVATDFDPSAEAPVFVCFKHAMTHDLRGCIGNFTPAPLKEQLPRYACAAAFEDSRFRPMQSEEELAKMSCTVSLLHSFEKMPLGKWDDWSIGVHGVQGLLLTPSSTRPYRATFLPHVATEQNWDHRTTLTRLLRKAGYEGDITNDILARLELTRYQESSCTATYADLFPESSFAVAGKPAFSKGCAVT
jgi:AMME syndrome candidate gene 1 protein